MATISLKVGRVSFTCDIADKPPEGEDTKATEPTAEQCGSFVTDVMKGIGKLEGSATTSAATTSRGAKIATG